MNTHNLRRASRPKIDDKGFSKAKITHVEEGTGIQKIKQGRDIIEKEYPAYIFHFLIEGVADDLNIQLQSSLNINDVPTKIIGKGKNTKNIYNRITTICLSLGLIKENELSTLSDKRINEIDESLKNIKDLEVTCKVVRNDRGFLNIDPESIKFITEQDQTKAA